MHLENGKNVPFFLLGDAAFGIILQVLFLWNIRLRHLHTKYFFSDRAYVKISSIIFLAETYSNGLDQLKNFANRCSDVVKQLG